MEQRAARTLEKPMRESVIALALCAMLFAPCFSAEAQQAGKVARIGRLDVSTASGSAVLWEAFRNELSKLVWIEERTSTSSTDLPSKSLNVCLS
jgi:hypothetical protein